MSQLVSKDIRFDIDRGQLALAANLATIKRSLIRVMSEKIAQKVVFPSCQGLSFTPALDLLDVRHPPVEGLLNIKPKISLQLPGLGTPRYLLLSIFPLHNTKTKNFKLFLHKLEKLVVLPIKLQGGLGQPARNLAPGFRRFHIYNHT